MCEGLSKISSNFALHLIKVGKLKRVKKRGRPGRGGGGGGGGGSGIPVYPKKIRLNTPKYPKFNKIPVAQTRPNPARFVIVASQHTHDYALNLFMS